MSIPLTINIGQTVTVSLAENPTTGFSWVLTVSAGLKIITDRYVPPSASIPGKGGIHQWIVQAIGVGPQLIHGIYRRPWESITGDEKQYFEHVDVISK